MKKFVSVVLASSLLVGGFLYVVPKDDSNTVPATKAALAWLDVVDRGDNAGSWNEAASLFQAAVDREQWVGQISAVRKPLGKVKSRALVGATYTTSLPGAPDGEYVVIQMKTSFEGKASAIETIMPMKDGKRGWRVSGYYIK